MRSGRWLSTQAPWRAPADNKAWDALKASNGSVVLISGSAALDPKPGFAAVATVNAAIIALAKAFAEQGIKDGVQVNSVVPGAVMTGRRESFFKKWAPAHNLTVEEAMKKFPEEVGIARFGKPEEIADLMALPGIPCGEVDDGILCAYGRRRNQRHLVHAMSRKISCDPFCSVPRDAYTNGRPSSRSHSKSTLGRCPGSTNGPV
jgi:NAD(P)-dependent dehydrogenase (short-subunit alcohol dehydrogenase family)